MTPTLSISDEATKSSLFKPNRRERRRAKRRVRAVIRAVLNARKFDRRTQKALGRRAGSAHFKLAWRRFQRGMWWVHARRAVATRPRPRGAHRPRGRAAPAPGRGETAPPEGEDGRGADDEDDESGGPPPPLVPRRAKGKRGRPRKRRTFKAWPDLKVWRKRLALAEAVAALPGAIFATLLPAEAPDEASRRLARVPAGVADRFSAFARRLRREPGAYFVIAAATRAERGAFWPHAHAVVAGVDPDRLAVLAARSGLHLAYAEPVRDGRAASRYALGAHQKRHWDRVEGGRGFWARAPEAAEATAAASSVSSRNAPAVLVVDTPLGPLPVVPGPVDLGPGVCVIDPARFLEANAEAAASPSPRIRGPALEALVAYANAVGAPLTLCGPPRPGAAPGKGGRQ